MTLSVRNCIPKLYVLSTEKSAVYYISFRVQRNSESYTETLGPAVRRLTSSATWNLHTRFFLSYFFTTISRNEKEFTFSYPLLAQFLDFSLFFLFFTLVACFFVDCIAEDTQFVFNICAAKMWKYCVLWEKKGKFKKKESRSSLNCWRRFFLSFCLNGF